MTEKTYWYIISAMDALSKIIYLVRHGSTESNDLDILQGRMDNPLSDKGREEVKKLADFLRDETILHIYSSPLIRAMETAEIINQYHHAPIQVTDSFMEIDLGEWEGQEFPSIKNRGDGFYQRWLGDAEMPVPGGESFVQVYRRAEEGVLKVLGSDASPVLICGHATINRAILGHFLGMNPEAARQFRQRNAAVSRFQAQRNGSSWRTIVDYWNQTSFLD